MDQSSVSFELEGELGASGADVAELIGILGDRIAGLRSAVAATVSEIDVLERTRDRLEGAYRQAVAS